jgi:RNA polymerase sigma-70 factor (ECF subfamily)
MIRSENELLAAHLAGDRGAFRELVDRLSPTLWSVARGALNSAEDAEEAVQDALIRASHHAGRFRGESSVATWVVRILVNVCLDRRRHNRSRQAVPLPGTTLEALCGSQDPIAALQTRMEVWAALEELPAQQRLPIVLVDVHDYPVAEVARMLGVPQGTVKSRCARGRSRLQTLLRDVEEVA